MKKLLLVMGALCIFMSSSVAHAWISGTEWKSQGRDYYVGFFNGAMYISFDDAKGYGAIDTYRYFDYETYVRVVSDSSLYTQYGFAKYMLALYSVPTKTMTALTINILFGYPIVLPERFALKRQGWTPDYWEF